MSATASVSAVSGSTADGDHRNSNNRAATAVMAADFALTQQLLQLVGAVAHVTFRVRCERLSHGEEVFLVSQGNDKVRYICVVVLVRRCCCCCCCCCFVCCCRSIPAFACVLLYIVRMWKCLRVCVCVCFLGILSIESERAREREAHTKETSKQRDQTAMMMECLEWHCCIRFLRSIKQINRSRLFWSTCPSKLMAVPPADVYSD
jgi:hypothetical protein